MRHKLREAVQHSIWTVHVHNEYGIAVLSNPTKNNGKYVRVNPPVGASESKILFDTVKLEPALARRSGSRRRHGNVRTHTSEHLYRPPCVVIYHRSVSRDSPTEPTVNRNAAIATGGKDVCKGEGDDKYDYGVHHANPEPLNRL